MGRKVLRDHAFTFCQMFMGWRMSEDLELFSQLPEGRLTINVLSGCCEHDSVGPVETYIGREIAAWFVHRLAEHHIENNEISSAILTVQLNRSMPKKGKRGITFHWNCNARIATIDRTYEANLTESHTWVPMQRTVK